MDYNEMLMAKLGQNPKFQLLSQIANEIGDGQMTALTGKKKKATSAQISAQLARLASSLGTTQIKLKATPVHKHAPAKKAADSAPSKGPLGSADPDAGSHGGGYGASNPNTGSNGPDGSGYGNFSSGNGGGSSSGASGPTSDPSSWNPADMKGDILAYDRAMFHYFDMLQSSQMNNPQDIIAFITALSKLAQVTNAPVPSGGSYAPHFQEFLNSLSSLKLNVNGKNMSFGHALGFALAVAAVYNQHQTGQDAQGFLNKILGNLGQTPGFLGDLSSYIGSGDALSDANNTEVVGDMLQNSDGGKQVVSNIVEQIGYGIQNSFGQIRSGYMSSYQDSIDQQLNKLQASGASIYDMMNLVLMSYDQSDDFAASYAIPIGDLGSAGNSAASMMQFLTPTGLSIGDPRSSSPYYIANGELSPTQEQQVNSFCQTFNSLSQEWSNNPALEQSGVASSVKDVVSKIGSIRTASTAWLMAGTGHPSLSKAFSAGDIATLNKLFGGQSTSVSNLMKLMKEHPEDKKLLGKYLIATLDYVNSTKTDPSTKVPSPDADTQAAINSLQTLQAQISSVNQSAKARFTNANQSAANLLSTVGGIEKNVVGMLNNFVQAQRF